MQLTISGRLFQFETGSVQVISHQRYQLDIPEKTLPKQGLIRSAEPILELPGLNVFAVTQRKDEAEHVLSPKCMLTRMPFILKAFLTIMQTRTAWFA